MVPIHRCQRPLTSRSSKARQQHCYLVRTGVSANVSSKGRTTAGRPFSEVKPSPKGSIRAITTIRAIRGRAKAGIEPRQLYSSSQESPTTVRCKIAYRRGRQRVSFDHAPNHIPELRPDNTFHTIILRPGLLWRQCLAWSSCERRETFGCSDHHGT